MPELSVKPSRTQTGERERERRAEALRRHRADTHVLRMAAAGELAYLRAQLRVASKLTGRLAAMRDADEMVQLVVDELHGTFAFYLAAIQRLDEDGVLRLVASRGALAEVMREFLLVEQSAQRGRQRARGALGPDDARAATRARTATTSCATRRRTRAASWRLRSRWTGRCGVC